MFIYIISSLAIYKLKKRKKHKTLKKYISDRLDKDVSGWERIIDAYDISASVSVFAPPAQGPIVPKWFSFILTLSPPFTSPSKTTPQELSRVFLGGGLFSAVPLYIYIPQCFYKSLFLTSCRNQGENDLCISPFRSRYQNVTFQYESFLREGGCPALLTSIILCPRPIASQTEISLKWHVSECKETARKLWKQKPTCISRVTGFIPPDFFFLNECILIAS